MPNIRTKEGREELRQRLRAYPFMGDHSDALDGLDIAEEIMWARAVLDYLDSKEARLLASRVWFYWSDAAEDALRLALAKWDKWKGEPE